MHNPVRFILWSLLIGALVAGALGGAGVVLTRSWDEAMKCESSTRCARLPFDSTLWKAYGTWNDPVRLKMVEDLVANHNLLGQSRAWVDEHLGTPETNQPFAEQCEYAYWLGPTRALVAVGFEYLCLNFMGDAVARIKVLTY